MIIYSLLAILNAHSTQGTACFVRQAGNSVAIIKATGVDFHGGSFPLTPPLPFPPNGATQIAVSGREIALLHRPAGKSRVFLLNKSHWAECQQAGGIVKLIWDKNQLHAISKIPKPSLVLPFENRRLVETEFQHQWDLKGSWSIGPNVLVGQGPGKFVTLGGKVWQTASTDWLVPIAASKRWALVGWVRSQHQPEPWSDMNGYHLYDLSQSNRPKSSEVTMFLKSGIASGESTLWLPTVSGGSLELTVAAGNVMHSRVKLGYGEKPLAATACDRGYCVLVKRSDRQSALMIAVIEQGRIRWFRKSFPFSLGSLDFGITNNELIWRNKQGVVELAKLRPF